MQRNISNICGEHCFLQGCFWAQTIKVDDWGPFAYNAQKIFGGWNNINIYMILNLNGHCIYIG